MTAVSTPWQRAAQLGTEFAALPGAMNRQPTRVLVIDDNPEIRNTIQWLLQSEGSEQDGIETIGQLRAEFPDVPVIVISGRGADYLVVARELGVRKTLQKPFDPKELVDVVHQIRSSAVS